MCCNRPRLIRDGQILISEYERGKSEQGDEEFLIEKAQQKSLADYSKKKK